MALRPFWLSFQAKSPVTMSATLRTAMMIYAVDFFIILKNTSSGIFSERGVFTICNF